MPFLQDDGATRLKIIHHTSNSNIVHRTTQITERETDRQLRESKRERESERETGRQRL